ncbi:cytochrome P450 [Microlunatus capsulatus]|uniref:Cytochrome P450 n=1 Tax=Microlunatus capsulatus TaxID=99117 RepID=A0ABS4Z535_9ACTN|nr:cytochrome P450 [Microlunatus capsulatus]MBP2415363.1 cytochrome P450 [Microlunatus capsulatus]
MTLPGDGTPLQPSPALAAWRAVAPATPLDYADGHRGLVVTDHALARALLEDPRFSMQPARMPRGPGAPAAVDGDPPDPLDDAGREAQRASLLSLDGAEHARLRRAVAAGFALKRVRARGPAVAATVASALARFRAEGSPNDLWRRFAQPVAARTHCQVLGVPPDQEDAWVDLFVEPAPAQERHDFIRRLVALRRADPGEDVVSGLLARPDVTDPEVEGLLFMLMLSGRDSVAYTITTTVLALLRHPGQLAALRADPALVGPAVEEFMRVSAMFLTLFPRTAREDVELAGCPVAAGTTVSVSAVAANRDPQRWDRPDELDTGRDAFGHLGFGHGIHGCIGQQLARVEITEAVRQVLLGLPGLQLVAAEQLAPLPFAHPVATYEAGELLVRWDATAPA